MTDSFLPLTDEQAKAIQEVAKAGGKVVDAARDLGPFLGRVFGQPIENTVGIFGDYLGEVRTRNAARMAARTEELLSSRGVTKLTAVSPSIAIPLLRAAQDETRSELQELWARLLANAMDSTRAEWVRKSFIQLVQSFDPIDTVVLLKLHESANANWQPSARDALVQLLKLSSDDVETSFLNLAKLDLLTWSMGGPIAANNVDANPRFTPTGRLFMRAIQS